MTPKKRNGGEAVVFTFRTPASATRAYELLRHLGLPAQASPLPGGQAGDGASLQIPLPFGESAAAVLMKHGMEPKAQYLDADGYRPFPFPVFTRAFGIGSGDTVSIVGSGGKTALLHRLAAESRTKTTLLSTTTKIMMPPKNITDRVPKSVEELGRGINVVFGSTEKGKLTGLSPQALAPWASRAEVTLLEADGSRGLPLKGWAAHEPVVPPFTTITIGVCTLRPVGHGCSDGLVHRLQEFCALTGAVPKQAITLEHIAAAIGGPRGMLVKACGQRLLFVNQVESREEQALAVELVHQVRTRYDMKNLRCFCGSVHRGVVAEIP